VDSQRRVILPSEYVYSIIRQFEQSFFYLQFSAYRQTILCLPQPANSHPKFAEPDVD
jgi:hypothetical protein